jgi:PTH1 family peptidyl-tRNA hydrolase
LKIIAGLGNPALKYGGTRHNVGFGVIDELSDRWNIRVSDSRMRGLAGSGVIAGEKIILLKPMTFMNLSGECIRPFMDYYKLFPEELIVCYDDINLDVSGNINLNAAHGWNEDININAGRNINLNTKFGQVLVNGKEIGA